MTLWVVIGGWGLSRPQPGALSTGEEQGRPPAVGGGTVPAGVGEADGGGHRPGQASPRGPDLT